MDAKIIVLFLLGLPVVAAIAGALVPHGRLAAALTTGLLALALVPAAMLLFSNDGVLSLGNWFSVGSLHITLRVLISPLNTLLAAAVVFISVLVHIYALSYIKENRNRFFSTLSFFTASMLGLIFSDQLFVLFCCWELMGFCSYLLIGFWRHKPEAATAATEALLINKAGDAGLLGAILLLYSVTGSWTLSEINGAALSFPASATLGCLFFMAIAAKSAQFPLHSWLPKAMVGPTPVSALIHAATLVAAGVILYARIYTLLPAFVNTAFAVAALFTALLGAYQALVTYDLKQILAYSTLSQLGLMIAAVALGTPGAALLHLFCHAFFKAGLFLLAGIVIYARADSHHGPDGQDIRRMGGLRKETPGLFILSVILLSALSGLPLFSGFVSKEAMITGIIDTAPPVVAWISVGLFFITALLTAAYSWRVLHAVFLRHAAPFPLKRPPLAQLVPVALLAAGSGWYAASLHPMNFEGGLASWFSVVPATTEWVLVFSAGWVVFALIVARFALRDYQYPGFRPIHLAMSRVLEQGVVAPTRFAAQRTDQFDRKWIDGFLHGWVASQVAVSHVVSWLDRHGVDGAVSACAALATQTGNLLRQPPRGRVQRYLLATVLGLIIFLFWMLK